jgi:O-antigen ligase
LFLALLVTGTLVSRRLLLGLAAAVAISLAVLLPTPPGSYAVDRVENVIAGRDASVTFRREVNEALVDIWRRAPYTGVGLGDSRLFLPVLVEFAFLPDAVVLAPSTSVYLGLLAETGPMGPAALVAAMLVLLTRTRTAERELEQLTRVLILFVGLQFLVIGTFILPPFWWWASLRIGLDRPVREPSPLERDRQQ